MDRRRFLEWLGAGVAAGAAAPSVIAKVGPTLSITHQGVVRQIAPGEHVTMKVDDPYKLTQWSMMKVDDPYKLTQWSMMKVDDPYKLTQWSLPQIETIHGALS